MKDNTLDPELIAIGTLESKNQLLENPKIVRTWRVNRTTGLFETIPTDGIECSAENAIEIFTK